MFRFLLAKLKHKKWMVLCLLIGNVLLIAVTTGQSIYKTASFKRMFVEEFDKQWEETREWPCLLRTSTMVKTYEEAESLASVIRIGGLKLQLQELCSKVVGAQLGSKAIATSLQAGAIGMMIVMLFMIVVYLLPGVAASLALVIYLILTILLLNGFEVTLTLPGIAGIILSIGMAVDANVIIFARIREELATGKTVRSAIKIGFQKALSAILDGNITTLIAALVLGVLGTGTVKGFAQTLALGIVLSMFTSLVVTRVILNAFYAIGFKDVKFYGVAKETKNIDFLSKIIPYNQISNYQHITTGFQYSLLKLLNMGDIKEGYEKVFI